MTNELIEKDTYIDLLRKQAEQAAAILKAKEKLFDQDNTARFQLGQKMQALFNEKEELLDNIEDLKVIKNSIC